MRVIALPLHSMRLLHALHTLSLYDLSSLMRSVFTVYDIQFNTHLLADSSKEHSDNPKEHPKEQSHKV